MNSLLLFDCICLKKEHTMKIGLNKGDNKIQTKGERRGIRW